MDIPVHGVLDPVNAVWWSDQMRSLLGYQDQADYPDRLGSWTNLLHPQDRQRTLDLFTSYLHNRSGQATYQAECRLATKTGEYRWFQVCGVALRDEHGQALRIAGSFRDTHDLTLLELEREVIDIRYREDIVVGLSSAPEALIGLLEGRNFGKLIVEIDEI